MRELELYKAFTLIEPGPVAMISTAGRAGRPNIMVVSWNMVLNFTPCFALATGPWNFSFDALMKTKECVVAIPTIDLLDKVVGVGTTSGDEIDKFEKFGFTAVPAADVSAPLIKECCANIECRVIDYISKHDIVVLKAIRAWVSPTSQPIFHYRGDGTFVADGQEYRRYAKMKPKMAPGL
jgi:flavin reductase (DIM6/NTAB) family NADH-FMN oxidoreductase RutF